MKNVATPVCSVIVSIFVMTGCASTLDRETVMSPQENLFMLEAESSKSVRIDTAPHPALDRLESMIEWTAQRPGGRDSMTESSGDCLSRSSAESLDEYLRENKVRELNVSCNEYSPAESLRRLQKAGLRRCGPFCGVLATNVQWNQLGSPDNRFFLETS
jgi:hypothetical protein